MGEEILGEKSVQEEFLGEESLGEKSVQEEFVKEISFLWKISHDAFGGRAHLTCFDRCAILASR